MAIREREKYSVPFSSGVQFNLDFIIYTYVTYIAAKRSIR